MKADPHAMRVDRKLLEQALINLIENAHRYTHDGAVIEVDAKQIFESGRLWLEISVSDNGPGIPPEDIPRIFERFYRADKSRNREKGGTGLGLAIVKHIMLSHQGVARVESHAGKGTRFSLLFPKNPILTKS
jgi:signal transduction histidine kinase